MRTVVVAVLRAVAVYGFAGWVYIASNAVFHPSTLPKPLTHFASWPREDTFGAVCFGVSFVAFVLHRVLATRWRTDPPVER